MLYNLILSSEPSISTIVTVAGMLQCLAMLLLGAQIVCTASVEHISGRAIGMEALASCCRLTSTLFFNGYVPVDESGDWFYQAVDLCSLSVAVWLLYQVFVEKRSSYKADEDAMPVVPLIAACFLMAALFHGNQNFRPFFDTMWMAALFLGTVSVLPQLWLIASSGGHVTALTSHYIAAMTLGRMMSGYFMWLAREEISCKPWITGINHAIVVILGAHFLHAVLMVDFVYIYIRALVAQGLRCELQIADCVVDV